MRFRGEFQQIKILSAFARYFTSLGKREVFAIGRETFCLIYKDSLTQMYSILIAEVAHLFTAFEYDGTEETVYLEFNSEDLLKILSNLKDSDTCQVSLTRNATKRVPCLNFKTTIDGMEVTQELIVEINKQGTDFYKQPTEETTQMEVSGEMHSLKEMKPVIDKMSVLSDQVVFSTSSAGDIRLTCSSKQSKMEVIFSSQEQSPDFFFSCECESKHFQKFFILEKLDPTNCEYYYDKDRYLIIRGNTAVGVVLIYIPVGQS